MSYFRFFALQNVFFLLASKMSIKGSEVSKPRLNLFTFANIYF